MKILLTFISVGCFFLSYVLFVISPFFTLIFVILGVIIVILIIRLPQQKIHPKDIVKPQQNANLKSRFENVGNIDSVCPYCNKVLGKKPGRKKECPYCSNLIYIRTRPADEQKVLVTEEQAEKIEEQWSIVNGTHELYKVAKQKFLNERFTLQKKFGRIPSDQDVKWSLLNKELTEHAEKNNWGLFRNVLFEMAEIFRKNDKLIDALELYLEICYIDLNGPNNIGNITNKALLKQFPPWEPKDSIDELAPAILDKISRISKKINLDINGVKNIYQKRASSVYASLRLPVPPDSAWLKITEALSEEEQYNNFEQSATPDS